MDRYTIVLLLNLALVFNVQADTKCNLKSIFKTPQRRDYDKLQIVERSNFLSDDPEPTDRFNGDFGAPKTNVLLSLGNYNNAVRRNNNNVNTKITLAGPNHNNYISPFLPPFNPPQLPFPWNLIFPVPKIPHRYSFVPSPSYVPQYQFIPQVHPEQHFDQKPKIIINDPIVFDSSAIQHIALPSQTTEENQPGNGLNTMTVIPKIIIDNVVNEPIISKDIKPTIEETRTPLEIEATSPNLPETTKQPAQVEKFPEVEPTSIVSTENIKTTETLSNYETSPYIETKPIVCTEPVSFPQVKEEPIVLEEPIKPCDLKPKEESILLAEPKSKGCPIVLNDLKPKAIIEEFLTPKEPCEIQNIDHPRILHPVELSNDIENVEIVGAGNVNISLIDNYPQRIEKYENAEDLAFENLLQKSLVPFINLRTNEKPKLLVSYPVVSNANQNIPDHPSAIIVRTIRPTQRYCSQCSSCRNRGPKVDIDYLNIIKEFPITPQVVKVTPNVYQSSNEYKVASLLSSQAVSRDDGATQSVINGYEVSSGSGCYEDPARKVIYKKPTEITFVTPQITKFKPNLFYPYLSPSTIKPVLPQLEILPQPIPEYIPSSAASKTKLVDLLKCLLTDIVYAEKTRTCPYCSNVIKVLPSYLKNPYAPWNPEVVYPYSGPIVKKLPCPYFTVPQNVVGKVWNPKPLKPVCPYCANYRGELNQLA